MRRSWNHLLGLGFWVSALLFAGVGARAFDDPVVRTVRLAYLQGSVTVLRADNTGGDPAVLNMPLTEGQRIATGDDGQAEVEFEDGSLLRLTPRSSAVLSRLGVAADGSMGTQVTLLSGLMYAELRAAQRYSYEVDAGGDTVTPVTNATVRLKLDQPPAEVAVLDGTAHVVEAGGNGFRVDVKSGEALRADGEASGRYFLQAQIEHDSWDDWNEEREQAAANEMAARTAARDGYAGDQGYGWSDLDANGTWYDAGQQGPVWQPFDAGVAGFDPYGYGSWVYVTGATGYVWSSGYRWGWTPFRCGSWSYWGDFGWGWRPGGGCGGAGWGGGVPHPGRGNRINLSNVPPGYKRPLPPVPGGPVRVHPILPVRTGQPPTPERARAYEARAIAGTTALPLRVAGSSYTPRGGSAVGSSLRRDFPVDTATRQPVIGTVRVPVGRPAEASSRPVEGFAGGGAVTAVRPGRVGTEGIGGGRRSAAGEEVSRPVYSGRGDWVRREGQQPAAGWVQSTPAVGTAGGGTLNSVPAPLHGEPGTLNTVPAPLHSEPAPLTTVPRVPQTVQSMPVRPMPMGPQPMVVRPAPVSPATVRPAAPAAPPPATTRPAPAPSPK